MREPPGGGLPVRRREGNSLQPRIARTGLSRTILLATILPVLAFPLTTILAALALSLMAIFPAERWPGVDILLSITLLAPICAAELLLAAAWESAAWLMDALRPKSFAAEAFAATSDLSAVAWAEARSEGETFEAASLAPDMAFIEAKACMAAAA